MQVIYENDLLFIEVEKSQIPWLKVFLQDEFKELTDCPQNLRDELWRVVLLCERALRDFYKPEKINIASFANYVPRVHFHIMARFKDDEFFPETMWGKPQRAAKDLGLPKINDFAKFLRAILDEN